MNSQEKVAILIGAAGLIFTSKRNNTNMYEESFVTNAGTFKGRTFVGAKIRGIDFAVTEDNGTVVRIRAIEQNPNKRDDLGMLKPNALLAQQGHEITWFIRTDTGKDVWLGKVMDGQWQPSQTRAVEKVTYEYPAPGIYKATAVASQNQSNEVVPPDLSDWESLPEVDPDTITGIFEEVY